MIELKILYSKFFNYLDSASIYNSASCDETNACCGLDANDASPAEDCCTDANPCSAGEGGCQGDSNCKGDLVCGSKNCDSSHGFDAGNEKSLLYYLENSFFVLLRLFYAVEFIHFINCRSKLLHESNT